MNKYYSPEQRIESVQAIIEYTFKETTKIHEALQAPGSSGCFKAADHILPDGNKRLALVGDAVLRMALVEECHTNGQLRAFTQQHISTKASNANLATTGRLLLLDHCINPGSGATAISNGTLADTMEAIIGAVYFDGGMVAARRVLRTLGLLNVATPSTAEEEEEGGGKRHSAAAALLSSSNLFLHSPFK